MKWGPNGEAVFSRTYARPKGDRSETWAECVHRVVGGNISLVDREHLAAAESSHLAQAVHNMGLLPAGRHLWSSNADTPRQYLMNCHRAGWGENLADHFCFTFDQLMTGGGVGANFSNSYLETLPMPAGWVECHIVCSPSHPDLDEFARHLSPSLSGVAVSPHRIDDSREGWVDALRQVLDLSQSGGGKLVLDVSDVRPRGSIIAGFGGVASGPGVLVELLVNATEVINECVGRPLTSLDAMAIDHEIAACVVAGGVRRSARMSQKSARDSDVLDFVTSKLDDPTAGWTSNISLEIDDLWIEQLHHGQPQATAVFTAAVQGMLQNGEPGFYHSDNASQGETGDVRATNPCGEQPLEDWEACCLGHINLAYYGTDLDGAIEAAKLMTRFLIRATNAQLDDPKQRAIVNQNRRIGVGLTGVQEWAAAHGVRWSDIPESSELRFFLEQLAIAVDVEADYYSEELGINRPIKTRTIAPTGTVSKLAGVSEGIHPIYARHFLQRMRYRSDDPKIEEHRAKGRLIEDDIYAADTKVVTIPTRHTILDDYDSDLIESVDEISVDDQLAGQAFFQKYWSDNAVSFTANIDPDTPHSELARALQAWLPHLKGTTVFTDKSRPLAPYERIPDGVYETIAGVLGAHNEVGETLDECSSGACPIR
jgi:ribonucleoside-triphosphate reductase